jgi:amino acid adenylation domain-containing protein
MNMDNLEDIYELSPLQQGLLFHTLYAPQSGVYFEQFSWTLKGNLNTEALRQAWQRVVDRHPILRTAFYWQDLEKPYQVVYEQIELPWQVEDWRHLDPDTQRDRLDAFLIADRQQGFELSQAPLMRMTLFHLSKETYHLVWSSHHLLLDGWSESLIFKEVYAFYEAFCQGKELQLAQPRPFRDYIVWLQQQDLTKAETFWRRMLKGFTVPTRLRVDRSSDQLPSQTEDYDWQRIHLSEATTTALQSLARIHQLTLNTLVQGAWALLLSRYSGESDVVFGVTSSGRPTDLVGVESMVGIFVNTLPLRVHVPPDASLLPWLKHILAQQIELLQYEYSPLVQVQGWSDIPRGLPLFETSQVLENYPVDATVDHSIGGFEIQNPRSFEKTNEPLSLIAVPDTTLRLELWYDTRRFDRLTICRMLGHLQTLLESFITYPEARLSEIPLLTAEEWQQLQKWGEGQSLQTAQQGCIHHLFEDQVVRSPDQIAIIFADQQLTYRELNERANQLAHHLQGLGVKSDVRVGVCVERSLDMVISILAILKAGGAYLPIDPSYPKHRIAFILEDAQVPLLLTQQNLLPTFPQHSAQILCLDSPTPLPSYSPTPPCNLFAQNLAYVIYTSGSTGQPKGVMVSHESVVNHNLSVAKTFELQPVDRVLQFASISFDVAVEELFPAWVSGATVVLTPRLIAPGPELLDLIEQEKLTVLNLPASYWHEWVRALSASQVTLPDSLRLVIVGSEPILPERLAEWQQLVGNSIRWLNAYGMTETTITTTIYEALSEARSPVPIGRPIANTQLYVLDQHRQPVPIGVPGELYIGGISLARGYLNRPNLTNEKFIPNPFLENRGGRSAPDSQHSTASSSRLYRTGDLVRYLPDGNLELLGRIDNQVKLRGFRIELGEISSTLNQQPTVQESVVLLHEQASTAPQLVAYVVPTASIQDGAQSVLDRGVEAQHLSQWQRVHNDEVFNETQTEWEPTFNISGWISSYTYQPIPAQEMQEWVDSTVDRILALRPQRVLEIGCGTGLLLFRIAPHCTQYWGTDFSQTALNYVQQVLDLPQYQLPQVRLWQRQADHWEDIEPNTFDTVILNSVIQYFPSVDYLLRVLEQAVSAVVPGGHLFIGDIRSLPLLETFYQSVECYQASVPLTPEQLRDRVQRRIAQEQELVIDPAFFTALQQHLPQITHVQIQPKQGRYENELNRFRYDVILQIGTGVEEQTRRQTGSCPWHTYANNPLKHQVTRELVAQWRGSLQQKLPDYMVPSAFVLLEVLPLTPNGKLDRRSLPAPDAVRQEPTEATTAPRTPIEEILSGIWAQVLGVAPVGIQDNFFELGGHSLLATQVISRVQEAFQIEVPLRYLFESPILAAFAQQVNIAIQTQQGLEVPPLSPVARSSSLPLSFAQQRLWFLHQLAPDSSLYNDPAALRLSGSLNVTALEQSLNEIARRHEVLRTRIDTVHGQPVQIIIPSLDVPLPIIDLCQLPELERETEALRLATEEATLPFDLRTDRLMRVTLLRLSETEHIILLTLHHIASDAWTMGVLVQELSALYAAFSTNQPSPLSELSIQYADFAVWQRQWLQGEVLQTQLNYWRRQLAALPTLELPTDKPRSPIQSDRAATQSFVLPQDMSLSLMRLSQQEGVTLFMTLLTAFKTLLHCYTAQTDIAVGSPIANRNRAEIENLIGFFVNTLVLRTDLSNNLTFRSLLERVRETTLGAYAHQDLPFEKLVEELRPERQQQHSPLFRVWFVLQNAPMPALELPGLTLTPLDIDSGTTKFDLALFFFETNEGLEGCFEYNVDLFESSTIVQMVTQLEALLHKIVAQPDIQLSALVNEFAKTAKEQQILHAKAIEATNLQRLQRITRKPLSRSRS